MHQKQIAVSPGQVVAGLNRIQDAIIAIKSDLSNLDDRVRRLEGQWNGEARQAYRVAQATWTRDLAHMVQLVTKLTAIANSTTENFVKVESRNAGAWK